MCLTFSMSHLTDKPMARAADHLAAGRYPQAIGAYRAVIGIDPDEYSAHVGIAEAEAARGNAEQGIDTMLEAAAAYAEQENHVAALALFGHALGMDPSRLEVHLDVAICESAAGHHDAAIERCEALAEMYLRAGRRDEAEEIFRFAASWEPGEDSVVHSA
ncbi:MAG: tetratricopeptide repeat protein, partial [Myxococcota bacterium]